MPEERSVVADGVDLPVGAGDERFDFRLAAARQPGDDLITRLVGCEVDAGRVHGAVVGEAGDRRREGVDFGVGERRALHDDRRQAGRQAVSLRGLLDSHHQMPAGVVDADVRECLGARS